MEYKKATGHGMLDGDQLLEALDSPALIVDGDGVILQLNRAVKSFCDRAGRPILCGAPVSELLPEIHAYWPKELQSFDTHHGLECVPIDDLVRVRGAPLCNVQGSGAGWLLLLQVAGDVGSRSEQRLRSLLSSMDDLVIVLDPDGRIVEYHQPAGENLAPSNGWMLGKYYRDIFPDPAARRFTEMMEIVVETGATHRFDQLVVVDGEERWYSANMGLLRDDDGDMSGFLVVARNITERKRIENAERAQRVLAEALQDVALALNSTLNLEEIWERILANIVSVVPADAAAILLVDEGRARVVGERGYSERDAGVVGQEIELDSLTRLRHMMETHRPYLIADARASASWTRRGKGDARGSPENRRRQWARSYLGAPILLDDEVIGFLKLESAVANYFTPTDAERLRAFAIHVASAIRNARLYARAQELAAFEERQRLARDLHDAVSQMLFSAKIIAEMLPRLRERDPDSVWTYLPELRRLIQGAMGEMRMLLMELRPAILTDVDLKVLLGYLVDATSARTSGRVSLTATEACIVPAGVQVALYRIAQEAVSNAVKHAHAAAIDITVRCAEGGVVLRIQDDGSGFDAADVRPENMGLDIMRERADEIGAQLRVASVRDLGTTVEVVWPGSDGPARSANGDVDAPEEAQGEGRLYV